MAADTLPSQSSSLCCAPPPYLLSHAHAHAHTSCYCLVISSSGFKTCMNIMDPTLFCNCYSIERSLNTVITYSNYGHKRFNSKPYTHPPFDLLCAPPPLCSAVTMSTSAVDSLQNALVDTISGTYLKRVRLLWVRLLVLVLTIPCLIVSLKVPPPPFPVLVT